MMSSRPGVVIWARARELSGRSEMLHADWLRKFPVVWRERSRVDDGGVDFGCNVIPSPEHLDSCDTW